MLDFSSKAATIDFLNDEYGVQDSGKSNLRFPSGISAIDSMTGGLPAGAITEIVGAHSSGRTSFMLSALRAASSQNDLCALIDTSDSLDISSATKAGIVLRNLLWVRCSSDVDRAFKATELLLRSGLFGLVVLDLCRISLKSDGIQQGTWIRLRRSIENTKIRFMVIGQQSMAKSLAGLVLQMQKKEQIFSSTSARTTDKVPSFTNLFRGLKFKVEQQRPFSINNKTVFKTSVPFN